MTTMGRKIVVATAAGGSHNDKGGGVAVVAGAVAAEDKRPLKRARSREERVNSTSRGRKYVSTAMASQTNFQRYDQDARGENERARRNFFQACVVAHMERSFSFSLVTIAFLSVESTFSMQ